MIDYIFSELTKRGICVKKSVSASTITSFRAGGEIDLLVLPKNTHEIEESISLLKGCSYPYMLLGGGTNVLFSDSGYRGAVIRLAENFSEIHCDNSSITADAGARLSSVCAFAFENMLYGMEFAGGIPGTVGGALVMNAGAYGGEIKDILVSAVVLAGDGSIKTISAEECRLSYRHSIFKESNMIVLQAVFGLKKGDSEEISSARAYLSELNARRKKSQPLEFPSAGSAFKRPAGYYAAALIDEAGLKGFRVGGACVSPKHAGFVVNDMNASSQEIYTLMQCVGTFVEEKSGVKLEPEVIFIGDFNV